MVKWAYDACAELAPCSAVGHAIQVKNETFTAAVIDKLVVYLQIQL